MLFKNININLFLISPRIIIKRINNNNYLISTNKSFNNNSNNNNKLIIKSNFHTSSINRNKNNNNMSADNKGTQIKPNTINFENELDKKGSFIRHDSTFREIISKDHPVFKPESGRYHLYVSLACPWACRCLHVIGLKGLNDVFDVSIVDYILEEGGWKFSTRDGSTVDKVNGLPFLKDVYRLSDKDFKGRVTVPVLFDKKTQQVVNNESSEIIRMFNNEFNEFAKNPSLDLYPTELRSKIDEINAFVYPNINNGVYRSGFAVSQEAYEDAYHNLFNALDKVDDLLSKQRYLVGSQFTEADVRLFTTLIRFDAVYVGHFKCNKKPISSYKNISNYLRELYQMPTMKDSVNFLHIKNHYYGSHRTINPYGIVPVGPCLEYLNEPHTRSNLYN